MDKFDGAAESAHEELKAARRRIKELEDRLAAEGRRTGSPLLALFDGADYIAVLKDENLRYVAVNRAYLELMGLDSEEDVVGKTDFELFAGRSSREHIQEYVDNDRKALSLPRGRSLTSEESFGPLDDVRTFLTKKFPVFRKDGGLFGVGTMTQEITERKRAERALAASEKRLADIIDFSPDPLFVLDRDGHVTAWNQAMAELTEVPASQLLGVAGTSHGRALYGYDRPMLADLVLQDEAFDENIYPGLEREGRRLSAEVTFQARTGRRVSAWASAAPLLSPEGEVVGAIECIRDVTRTKDMERELRESEERFRQVVENIREAIWVWDAETMKMTYVSPVYEQVFGRSRQALLEDYQQFLEAVEPEDRDQVVRASKRLRDTGKPVSSEIRVRLPDGGVRWLWARAYPVGKGQGGSRRQVGIAEDITERKKAEGRLHSSLERFRMLVGMSPDAIFQTDAQGRITYASPRTLELLDVKDASEVQAVDGLQWLAPEDRERALANIREVLSGVRPPGRADEYTILRKDGSTFVGSISAAPLLDFEGRPAGMICVGRDVTEKRRMEESLLAAKEAAEAASQAKSEFLANMSHEIRTPLNAILGMLQLLSMSELTDDQREDVQTAESAGQGLLRIISDILDLSRIEAGRMDIIREPFSLEEVVQPVVGGLREEAGRKGIELLCDIDPSAPDAFVGDAARLRQILFNLVGNAVKYTDEGSVRLAIWSPQFPEDRRGVVLHIAVEDTGTGIPDDKLDHVFESFTQVDGSYTRSHGGVGLGLGIVKRLVELMDGSLAISTKLGEGTQMHLSLRLPPDRKEHASSGAESSEGDDLAGRRILLVEDETVNMLACRRLLEKLGLEVSCAGNGQEALDILERQEFDVVLMDVQMPVMDGMTAARTLRLEPHRFMNPEVPVIALTAHAMPGDREKMAAAGMEGFASKPVALKGLASELRRVLRRRKGGGRE